jgi:hypothetical protein
MSLICDGNSYHHCFLISLSHLNLICLFSLYSLFLASDRILFKLISTKHIQDLLIFTICCRKTDTFMNNQPRQALRDIVAKHGTDVCSDSKRCAGLLRDSCGSYRREINILVNALEERIPLDLLAGGSTMPRELVLSRLARRLEEQLGMTETAAIWGVETWALALNVITENELRDREDKRAEVQSKDAEAARINSDFAPDTKNEEAAQKIHPPQTEPDKQRPTPRQPLPQNKPPVFAAPPATRQTTPGSVSNQTTQAPIKHQSGSKNAARVNQAQSVDSTTPARPKTLSKTFRGCFIGCFLIIILLSILIVGVPYAFNVMRQTQQPEIEDQRRVPAQ